MNVSTVKGNAKQAFGELFGRIGFGEEPRQADPAPPQEALAEAAPPAPVQLPPTVIAAGTQITGEVRAEGPIEVGGTVDGGVFSKESVRVSGTVIGAVRGSSVLLLGGRVRGDVAADSSVTLDAQAVAVGDLAAACVQIDGRLKGNVTARGAVRLLDRALVAGDVTASHFAMGERSALFGTVHVTPPQGEERDLETAFDF